MKKLTSILCALMVMLSVNATPVLTGFQKMSKDDFAKQQVLKTNMDKKAPVAKMTLEAQLAKHAPAALTIRKAPAAKMDTYNVTIATYKATFWEAEVVGDPDDVQYIMDDADGDFRFAFDIYVAAGDEDVVLGQTYTLSDMIADYTWGGCPNTEEEFADFTAVTFVKTMTDGLVNITVNVTDEDGNIYNIVYQEEPLPVATDTIEVVYDAADVTLTDATKTRGIFQFIGKNAAYWSYVCVKSKTIEGTYTNDDMYLDYTALYDLANDTTEIDALAGDAVVTRSNDTLYLSAYLLGEDAHCYHVMMSYYDEPFVPTGDTVIVNIANPMTYKYYSSQGDWWFQADDADYKVAIDVVNNDPQSPAGVYTMDDVLANYTYVTLKADDTKLATVDLAAVVTYDSVAGQVDLVADMLMEDGNVYHVNMFYAIPQAEAYDTIVATNLDIEEETVLFWTVYVATASNAAYQVELSLDADTAGTYEAAGTITPLNGVATQIYSGDITLSYDSTGCSIVGDVLCYNNTEYHLDLTFVMPTKTREAVVTVPNAGFSNMIANYGAWEMYGFNADSTRFIDLVMKATQVPGTYTRADIYGKYATVYEISATDTVAFNAVDVNVTVAVAANGDITLGGTMLCVNENDPTDVPEYTIAMTYVKPTASRQVTVTIPEAQLTDYSAESGVWQAAGYNAAGDVLLSVTAYNNQVAGTYTYDMFYQNYTYVVEFVNGDTLTFSAVDGNFTATVDDNNVVTIAGKILFQNDADAADVPEYTFTMTTKIATGIQYDEEEDDFNRNYASYEVEDQYLAQNGIVFVIADDGSSQMILEFLTPAEGIVDGTYAINQSEEEMTVWAGDGWDDEGYPNYSFVLTYEGKSIQQIWFMVEGTVTVQAGKITVNAVNSYGRTIKAVLNNGTGVETVKATENNGTEKFMRNGNLIIRRNGVEYNAQGAEL